MLPLLIDDASVDFIVDTGASVSVLDIGEYRRLASGYSAGSLVSCSRNLKAVNGTSLPVYGETEITFKLGGRNHRHTFVVSEMPGYSGIVGIDFCDHFQSSINFATGEFCLGDVRVKCGRVQQAAAQLVVAHKRTLIFPGREIFVKTRFVSPFSDEISVNTSDDRTCLVEPSSELREQYSCLVACVLVPCKKPAHVVMLNMSSKTVCIPKDAVLGVASPVCENKCSKRVQKDSLFSVSPCDGSDNNLAPELEAMLEGARHQLSSPELALARKVIAGYSDVFALPGEPLGRTTLAEHCIDTGDTPPFREKMRRYAPAQLDEIDHEVDRMLDQDVIEPSSSPWSTPILVVKKKDGSARLCLDLRRLNKHTVKKDCFPLPRIDHALDTLGGSRYFCTLDLMSGYWQLPLAEKDREKTAFSVPRRGHFQFKVMPFGLCNAPASFERLMERVLKGLQWDRCLVYLDDIIVMGKTLVELVDNLSKVLDRLRDAGMKLKPSKCVMFSKKVRYLGHIVSDEGIACDPEKISAVMDWPTPSNLHELRSFLGLANYYRSFIQDFSSIAEPLLSLTRKGVVWNWSPSCQQAFDSLKQSLTESSVMVYPDHSKKFILDTDASASGMGAVLSQEHNGQERVVAYASKTFSKSQRNYCATKRELLAVVTFVEHFKHFLYGVPFTIRTDHASLVWLVNFKNPEGMLARWITKLGQYNFTIQHRVGSKHCNADSLSRKIFRKCSRKECRDCCSSQCKVVSSKHSDHVETLSSDDSGPDVRASDVGIGEVQAVFDLRDVSWDELGDEQLRDPEIGPVVRWKLDAVDRPPSSEVDGYPLGVRTLWAQWDSLRLVRGVLCREKIVGPRRVVQQVILPCGRRREVMRELHDAPLGGHRGIWKTINNLQRRVYWPGQRADVRRWVQSCPVCQATKTGVLPRRHPLQQRQPGFPLERVGIDIIGRINPPSTKGNQYILVIEDYYSKFLEAIPLKSHTADVVADAFITEWVSRYGCPKEIHTDQGREFESQLFNKIMEILDIKKTRTSPYRPQSDGVVERGNKSLKDMIKTFVIRNYNSWDVHLPLVVMAYRSTIHETTGCTPNLLFLGRECNTPLDWFYKPPEEIAELPCPQEYIEQMRQSSRDASEYVRQHFKGALSLQKKTYDKKSSVRSFASGDLVYREYPPAGLVHKFASPWHGPYRVLERVGDVNYKIQLQDGSRAEVVVHVDHLKRYFPRSEFRLGSEDSPPPDDVQSPAGNIPSADVEPEVESESLPLAPPSDPPSPSRSTSEDGEVVTTSRTGRVVRPYRDPDFVYVMETLV